MRVRIWYLLFSFWVTSLCIIGSRLIHLIRTDSNVFLLWLSNIVYMYDNFFIHSSVDGHRGCFHVLAIVNSAAVNIGVHAVFFPCRHTLSLNGFFWFPFLKKIGSYGWVPELLYHLKQCLQTNCFCLSYSFRRTFIFQGCSRLSFWPEWRHSGSSEW